MITRRDQNHSGLEELRAVRREFCALIWAVGIFGAFCNILMLSGPLYMLQVYDRVLSSRSVETLVALTLLLGFLYGIMGLLDFTRGRVLARIGARFQSKLDRRVFDAAISQTARGDGSRAKTALADVETIQRVVMSPAPNALFDLPWTPVFLIGISIFHPWLGYLSAAGGAMLILIAFLNQKLSRAPQERANMSSYNAALIGEKLRSEAEMVQSLGMQEHAYGRWQAMRAKSLNTQVVLSDLVGGFGTLTKTFRLFLQSAMLGLGAYLAILGELSPGAMIAGSILMGRALAPIELAIGHWANFQRAHRSWWNLAQLLTAAPPNEARTQLPVPKAKLDVQSVTLIPPGQSQATLRLVNFTVKPGEALGVIGQSGAGKSTLARALTASWRPAGGKIRLDGAALEQYAPEHLGEYIGHLPQRVQLFDGTIAENIARLSLQIDSEKVVAAAKKADAHNMILQQPNGYETQLSSTGSMLSGGQIQRIGLARALYSNPVLLVLDEPNSNLDHQGEEALNNAIRGMKADGRSVVVMAHRPSAIKECDTLLMLEAGSVKAFGPRDDVLRNVVRNHSDISRSQSVGGVR